MTEPSYPQLREALADLADRVAPADLTPWALRTSRRILLQRVVVIAVVLIAVVGGGTATAVQILPVAGHQANPATNRTATPGPGSSSAGPVSAIPPACPASSVPVDPGPSPAPGGRPPAEGPAPNTGPLFYLQPRPGSTVRLVTWTPGQSSVVQRRDLPADAAMNANVSPDGKWVSWVTLADGALHLAALGGDKAERVLRTGVDGWLLEPVWARDSARLLARDRSTGRVGTVDIRTGGFTPLPTNLVGARHAVWAADGTAIAFVTADGGILVAKPDGSDQQRVPLPVDQLARDGRKVAGLQSMSGTAAGFAAISLFLAGPGQHPDGCRSLVSNTMVYTAGGRPGPPRLGQDPAQRGGQYGPFQSAYRGQHFAHVDRELDRPRTINLIGDNGEYWGGADEPAQLSDYLLLNR
jgi:hypothetical protein